MTKGARLREAVAKAYAEFKSRGRRATAKYNAALDAYRKHHKSLTQEQQRDEIVRVAVAKMKAMGAEISRQEMRDMRELSATLPLLSENPRTERTSPK